MDFYRYDLTVRNDSLGLPDPIISLSVFKKKKETPAGYWITDRYGYSERWISKTSVKRFAYPTKKEALLSFKKRTQRRIKILNNQLRNCRAALDMLETPQL